MIIDNRGDASHEGQSCRHVQMKMEGLAEPEIREETGLSKYKMIDNHL